MLARKSLLAFGTDILKALFGFAATYFTARYLGAVALGTIGYLLGLIGTLAFVSDLGIHQAFRKCASERPEQNGGYVGALILLKAALGVMLFGACWLAPWVDQRLAAALAQADLRGAYWSIAVYYLVNSFAAIPTLTFQARRETAKYTLPGTIGALISSVAKCVMALARTSLTWLAVAYALETIVSLVVSMWILRRYPIRRPSQDEFAHLLDYAKPMFWVTVLAYILPNVDRILLERTWDASEVGYYTAVIGLVALLQRVPLAAMGIFLPQASEDVARGELHEVQRRLFVLERYLLMITVPMCVMVALGSSLVTRLYLGEEFGRSGPILAVLAMSPLLTAFFEPYDTIVYAIEKHRYLVPSGVLSLAALLIADALLVPPVLWGATMLGLGGLGAALGSLISQAVNGSLQVYIARRYAGVRLYVPAIKFLAAGLAMAVANELLRRMVGSGSWLVTALALIAGCGVYLLALSLQHEFGRADARMFLGLLHPGRMAGYVGTELPLGPLARARPHDNGDPSREDLSQNVAGQRSQDSAGK